MDVKVESGGRRTRSRVIPVKYRIRCDPTALDQRQTPDQPPEPPDWPTDENGFLAYTDKERDEIIAALDRVDARHEVVLEEREVHHIVCDLEAAASVGKEHQSWSRSDAGFVAPTAAERNRIEATLTRAHVPYTVNTRAPDQEFLRRLEGRVTTRSAALAAMATGTLPPVLGDITEMSARLDGLAAAEAMMPEARGGRVSRSEKVSVVVLAGGAITCIASGIGHVGEGRARPGWALLAIAWVLVTLGLFLLPNLRTKWRWCGLPIALSLVVGGMIVLFGALGSKPNVVPSAPSGIPGEGHGTDALSAATRDGSLSPDNTLEPERAQPEPKAPLPEGQQPRAPAPLVGAGATVSQQTSGDNSHNVIASGDVTINPPADPNAPVVYYFPSGKKRTQIGSTITIEDGRVMACQTILSLNASNAWEELAGLCEREINATPDWLTPYLYAGVAHANLGDLAKARERLEEFKRRASGNRDYASLHSRCVELLAQVEER